MIDRDGALDVIGVLLTVALILFSIAWSLRALYCAQEAAAVAEAVARRRRDRRALQNSPVARIASRK